MKKRFFIVLALITCLIVASTPLSTSASTFIPSFTNFVPLYSSNNIPSLPERAFSFNDETAALSDTWTINQDTKPGKCRYGGLIQGITIPEESTVTFYFRLENIYGDNEIYFAIMSSTDLWYSTLDENTKVSKKITQTSDQMDSISVKLPAGTYYFATYSIWMSYGNRTSTVLGHCYATYDEGKKEVEKAVVNPPSSPAEIKDLPAVSIRKPQPRKKAATIKWKKLNKAKRNKIAKIQIQYSRDKNFKSNVKTVYAKKTAVSIKISKLKAKKKYYVRIRAYKKVDNTLHVSRWSTTKSVKAK